MGHARPLFRLFSSFQTNITNVKICPSSMRCWDSNSRPSEHEYPHITTRPVCSYWLCKTFSDVVAVVVVVKWSGFDPLILNDYFGPNY